MGGEDGNPPPPSTVVAVAKRKGLKDSDVCRLSNADVRLSFTVLRTKPNSDRWNCFGIQGILFRRPKMMDLIVFSGFSSLFFYKNKQTGKKHKVFGILIILHKTITTIDDHWHRNSNNVLIIIIWLTENYVT